MFAPNQRLQLLSRVPLSTIDGIVSARLGVTRVRGNAQPAVFNRQVAMYLAKHVGGWSTPRIGKFYNGRHHTTVLWAVRRIGELRTSNPEVDALLSALTEEIRSQPLCPTRPREIAGTRLLRGVLMEEVLDGLADRIIARLKSQGINCPS